MAAEGAGIFRPTGAVPRDTITAAFNADPQKIGRAAEVSRLPMPRDFMAATANER
jgi:hypothetical protein